MVKGFLLTLPQQNGRVSPRTNSHSDKQSGSPSNMSPTTDKHVGKDKKSPRETNTESHNLKMARMEAKTPSGFGGGIPAKIDEVAEPVE